MEKRIFKSSLVNPSRFLRLLNPLAWPLLCMGVILLCVGVSWGFFFSPPDYQQGETVRIMYVHVPASWMALMVYGCIGLSAFGAIIWRHGLGDIIIRAAAPLGCVFASMSLVTGALWGKPMWGAWWVWDARLTSMLILWFIYLGLIFLTSAYQEGQKGAKPSAIFALMGLMNLPIIKWSVDWWHTLHQPASLLRVGGNAIHSAFMGPLIAMLLSFICIFCGLLILSIQAHMLRQRLKVALTAR